VKDKPNAAALYGEQAHKAAEDYVAKGTPIEPKFHPMKAVAEVLNAMPGEKFPEMRMGIKKVDGGYEPSSFTASDVWWRGIADLVIINGEKAKLVDYKGLPVDTPIPTPTGFVPMGALKRGDLVFGSDGRAYPVTAKSNVHTRQCYEVMFDDKTTAECDDVHLWLLTTGEVVPVTALIPRKSKVQVCAAVDYPKVELPIDPYVFGLWLADGAAANGEICKPDSFVWGEIARRGYNVGPDHARNSMRTETRTVYGLRAQLRKANLLGRKHIPEIFLRSHVEDRLALLRGLMDGDGSVNPLRKQVVFANTNKELSTNVKQLVESLGLRCSMSTQKYYGFGVTGIAHYVSWRPRHTMPFSTPRKATRVGDWGDGRSAFRRVIGVKKTAIKQTQCISVGSPDNTYLCTTSYIPTHNTGKNAKYADVKQLDLMAGALFVLRPELKVVKSALAFVVSNDFISKNHTADLRDSYLGVFDKDLDALETAHQSGVWNPISGPLCGWCPVTSCPHYKERY